MKRALCVTRKVSTEFGSCYIHLDIDAQGVPVGGNISTPMKEPASQITRLIHTLSEALDDALGACRG
jgi:hypothetical protein